MRGAEREAIMQIIDLFIKVGIPAFIALVSITTIIDVYVIMPLLANNIDNSIRE
jgi:hypothetical protein